MNYCFQLNCFYDYYFSCVCVCLCHKQDYICFVFEMFSKRWISTEQNREVNRILRFMFCFKSDKKKRRIDFTHGRKRCWNSKNIWLSIWGADDLFLPPNCSQIEYEMNSVQISNVKDCVKCQSQSTGYRLIESMVIEKDRLSAFGMHQDICINLRLFINRWVFI